MFFFLLSVISGGKKDGSQHAAGSEKKMDLTFSYSEIHAKELTGFSMKQIDSLMAVRNVEPTKINTFMILQMHKMVNGSSAEFSHVFMKNISYMMFLLMPLFGFSIYVFNKKSIAYYIESLVISIHFHSFVFFTFTILLLAGSMAGMELFLFLEFLIIPIYMLLMFKGALKQGWLVTIGKSAIIGVLYLVSLLSLLLLTIVMSIAFI